MIKVPSRTINEQSQVMGLNGSDLLALGFIFLVLQQVFVPFGLEWVPLFISLILTIVLVSVRLKYRRKIIRDFFKYFLVFYLRGGYFYVRRIDKKF